MIGSAIAGSQLVQKTEAQGISTLTQSDTIQLSLKVAAVNSEIKEPIAPTPKPTTIPAVKKALPKSPVIASSPVKSGSSGDARAKALETFLRKKGSYLANYTGLIVELSDQYGVDYRLLVAIAGAESGYCKVNFRPYNCWGYGKSGWASEEDGIRGYMAAMNKGYFSKGLRTVEAIAQKYNPWPGTYISKVYYHWNLIG